LIVANDVSPEKGVFGGDRNTVHLVSDKGVETWPEMSKQDVARRLMEVLALRLPPLAKAAE
jgi:phosphopantothenoylcysteine decarboxylase/phosphopantothenate--cysteine ligase